MLSKYTPLALRSKQPVDETLVNGKPATWQDVHPSMWCVTRQDLQALRKELKAAIREGRLAPPTQDERDALAKSNEDYAKMRKYDDVYDVDPEKWDPSVYCVMDKFLKPCLKELGTGTSWALNSHPEGLECDVFTTHAWTEGIFEFIDAASQSFPWPAENMYVCFLGNPQDKESLEDMFASISSPHESPFAKALESARWFIVVPTQRLCIYKRLWCVFEMFLAQKRVHAGRDLKIRMRGLKSNRIVLSRALLLMMLVPLPGFLVSYYFIAHRVGHVVGPLMWLLIFHLLGSSVWFSIHVFSDRCLKHQHPHDIPTCELYLMMTWTYARLALFGFGGGLALRELQELHSSAGVHWEKGEGFACSAVFVSFALMYTYDMLTTMVAEIVHNEGGKLDHFETVMQAECYSEKDNKDIHEEIDDDIDEIDEAIQDLRVIGKYDEEVIYNLRLGMPPEVIRQGVNPFQVICGVCAWAVWLTTDLYAEGLVWIAWSVLVALSILGVLIVYGPRTYEFRSVTSNEKLIFAITSFMWAGVFFAVLSNSHDFFRRNPVRHHTMSLATLPLLLVVMCLWIILNALYYTGILAWYRRLCVGTTFHDHDSVKEAHAQQRDSRSSLEDTAIELPMLSEDSDAETGSDA